MPLVNKWTRNIRRKYRNIMATQLEKYFSSAVLFNAIAKWRENLFILQRALKYYTRVRAHLYEKLLILWNEAENVFFNKKKPKLKRKLTKIKQKSRENNSSSTIPEEIKRFYIKDYITNKLSGYLKNMKVYSEQCKEVDYINKKDESVLKNISKQII